jgi:hypothetical protein
MPTAIEIFKPGRHVDMRGTAINFSAAELEASAKAYDPKLHEAPIVIGHPKHDDPAFGWVKSVQFAEDRMVALGDQINPAFAEAVDRGDYKKVSASFYTPKAPGNPVPGVYYLRHVGFLGAQVPAVKGLQQVAFADSDEGLITVEFGDWNDRTVAGLFRSMRDWLIAKFGQEDADKALPSWDVTAAQEAAVQPEPGATAGATGFSEGAENASGSVSVAPPAVESPECSAQPSAESNAPADSPKSEADATAVAEPGDAATPTPPAGEDKAAELARREAELKRREEELAAREQQTKLDSHTSYLESLVKDGRPLPCAKETVVGFMRLLDGEGSSVVSFGEGESRTALDLFKEEFLAHLPRSVEFRELSGGHIEDDDPAAIASQAVAYQEEQRTKGVFVSTTQAVEHVRGAR